MEIDQRLIAQFIAEKDQRCFTQLVQRHQSAVRNFLRRLTAGDHHAADDIAQETFMLMYRKLESFNGQSLLSTWLHKIAYNCFLQHQQKANRYTELDDNAFEQLECLRSDLTTDIMVEQLMATLNVEERLVMTLAYSAGMSHGEIQQVTDMPLGTIKSHITRAKQKLTNIVATKR